MKGGQRPVSPAQAAVADPGRRVLPRSLNGREKAAVIVRLLLSEGTALPLAALPDHLQARLTEQIGKMRLVDRATLSAVINDFLTELEEVGLSFPGGIEGALTIMDGHISPGAAGRLRRMAAGSSRADPWERIAALPLDRLLPVIEEEGTEVAAVLLSKLPVPKAADLLGRMTGDRARRIAYAVSLTGNVDPETVRRIGQALAARLDNQPLRAFETGPVQRVGAILNVVPQIRRDDVLEGLESEDAGFAEEVRKAIFTFLHIPARIAPRDVPKVIRMMDQPVLVTALAVAMTAPETALAAEFLLSNMSQRMAQALREEMETRGKVRDRDAETAMNAVILTIRDLENAGELVLVDPEEEG